MNLLNLNFNNLTTKGKRRRESYVNFYTSGGDLGIKFLGKRNLRFGKARGYRVTLGFGGGIWYFKLWNRSGVQIGTTLARPSLSVLSAVINANGVMQDYLTVSLQSGVTTVTGSTSLNFVDASPFRGGR